MPKLDLTTDEQTIVLNALAQATSSAQRAQKTGKTPRIREVYLEHERVLRALEAKIAGAKN